MLAMALSNPSAEYFDLSDIKRRGPGTEFLGKKKRSNAAIPTLVLDQNVDKNGREVFRILLQGKSVISRL